MYPIICKVDVFSNGKKSKLKKDFVFSGIN